METLKYFLEFTFQSFWHFIGVFLLLSVIANGVFGIFKTPVIINKIKSKEHDDTK